MQDYIDADFYTRYARAGDNRRPPAALERYAPRGTTRRDALKISLGGFILAFVYSLCTLTGWYFADNEFFGDLWIDVWIFEPLFGALIITGIAVAVVGVSVFAHGIGTVLLGE